MAAIYPITATRVSDALILTRLMSQIHYDQEELLRLQDQVSTGYRISTPSQDAPAATRAVTLQRLLDQKQQARTNLNTTDSFINATDTTLLGATELLSHVKSLALRAINSTTTPEQREVLRTDIRNTIQQFLDIGNRQFRGRYLFSGATDGTRPFEEVSQYVAYNSNDNRLRNFIDVDLLSETNVTGASAFGALSAEIQGTVDWNPVVNLQTRLADLHNGRGITLGSLIVSDGSSTSTVDLSHAETLGDVVEMLAANPPEGRDLNVYLSATGLVLDLDDAGGGSLTVRESPGGVTAAQLGILNTAGVGVGPLTGEDLDPILRPTTRLADILGTRAQVRAVSSGEHNDLFIEAVQNGAAFNNTEVRFVAGAIGDQAIAAYDSGTNVLTVQISPGVTRAATAAAAIQATGLFTAELDSLDDPDNNGSGVLTTGSYFLAGGSGETLDRTSGIQIVNGGETFVVTFENAETVEDLLNLLNDSGHHVNATLNATRTGIDVRSRLSGTDFAIGENGGTTATQLGIRSLTEETYLSELNYGQGITDLDGDDLLITRRDGVLLQIDLTGANTIGDVLDRINGHPANVGNTVVASLVATGNGIQLADANAAGTQDLTVSRGNGYAAWGLGLVPIQQDSAVAPAPAAGQPQVLTGTDTNPREADGIFNSLLRLDQALENFDLVKIERAAAKVDDNFLDLTFVKAELGARASSLATLRDRIEQENTEIRATLATEIETDFPQAASELAARQANLQASLQLVSRMLNLSIFDYL